MPKFDENSDHTPKGFRKSPEYSISVHPDLKYIQELQKKPLKVFPKLTEAEILAQQTPSTQSLMKGTYADDYPDQDKWMANEAAYEKWVKSGYTDHEAYQDMIGARNLSSDEVIEYQRHRQASKNTFLQSEKSSVSEEKKQKAALAYTYSPPAILTKEDMDRVVNLVKIISAPPTPPEQPPKKQSFWQKLFGPRKPKKYISRPTSDSRIVEVIEEIDE